MTARTIEIHNHGYAKTFIDGCRRGEGERYGIRPVKDSKGDLLLRPDGVSFRLQSKRTAPAFAGVGRNDMRIITST